MESIAISMRLIPPRICIHNFYNDYHTSHQVKPFRSLIVNLFAIELIHIPRQGKHFKILTAPCRSFCVGYLHGKMNQSRSYEPSTTNKNDIANLKKIRKSHILGIVVLPHLEYVSKTNSPLP